jgi:uncharacterized protein (DUF2236 family)
VAQCAVPARLLGATELPTTVTGLHEQLSGYRPQLELTPAARDAARLLLLQPPLPLVARPGYATLAAGALGVLPPWAIELLGLPLPGAVGLAGRAIGGLGSRAVRWAMAGVQRRSEIFERG